MADQEAPIPPLSIYQMERPGFFVVSYVDPKYQVLQMKYRLQKWRQRSWQNLCFKIGIVDG